MAADSIPSEDNGASQVGESRTIFDDWLDSEVRRTGKREWILPPTSSPFQTILGISTVDVSLKNLDAKKMLPSPIEMQSQRHMGGAKALVEQARQFLDRQHLYSAKIARFALVLAMRMVSSPDVPLSASAYARRIHDDVHALQVKAQGWSKSVEDLGTKLEMEDISKAMIKLDKAAER